MRAVVIGPGRVGCGFAGHLLHRSGFEVSFIARSGTAARLSQAGHYLVRLTGCGTASAETVPVASAVDMSDLQRAADLVTGADVVGVAVGTRAFYDVAPIIAAGLCGARHPVTLIAFENDEHAGRLLRHAVERLTGHQVVQRHSFSGAVVDRAVAHRILPDSPEAPMLLVGDAVGSFTVDGRALHGQVPSIEGMSVTDEFGASYRRKLYRYSAGHATVAYLGQLKGYRNFHAAVLDPEIVATARAAMQEGQAGLAVAYGPSVAGTESELDAILDRFGNAALADTVARVGRDPRRKLGPEDRLIGPARLASGAGLPTPALATAAAAALCFRDVRQPPLTRGVPGADPTRASRAVGRLMAQLSGVHPADPLSLRIQCEWARLAGRQEGNLLLSLREPIWACSPDPLPALVRAS